MYKQQTKTSRSKQQRAPTPSLSQTQAHKPRTSQTRLNLQHNRLSHCLLTSSLRPLSTTTATTPTSPTTPTTHPANNTHPNAPPVQKQVNFKTLNAASRRPFNPSNNNDNSNNSNNTSGKNNRHSSTAASSRSHKPASFNNKGAPADLNQHHNPEQDHNTPKTILPLAKQYRDPSVLADATKPTADIITWFQKVALSHNADLINQGLSILQNNTPQQGIPPQVYQHALDCNIRTQRHQTAAHVLTRAIQNNVGVSTPIILSVVRDLSLNGYCEELFQIAGLVQLSPTESNQPTPGRPDQSGHESGAVLVDGGGNQTPHNVDKHDSKTHNQQIQSFDAQTVREVREALVFSYLNKSRTTDAVESLLHHFGPGSGVLPSNHLITAITEQLLKFQRPRHALQFLQNYDMYCYAMSKRKLYSKIASRFLDLRMIPHLDSCLQYMQANNITPHQTVLGPLLKHVLKNNDPLVTLQWYKQVFGAHHAQNIQTRGKIDPHAPSDEQQKDHTRTDINDLLAQTAGSSTASLLQLTLNNSNENGNNQDEFDDVVLQQENNTNGDTNNNNNNNNDGFNISAANAILRALFQRGYHQEALDFLTMLPPHISVVTTIIQEFSKLRDWDSVRLTFKYMMLRGLPLNTKLLHILIDSLAFHSNPQHGLQSLLYNMVVKQNITLDMVTFAHFVRAFNLAGLPHYSEQLLEVMISHGVKPDSTILTMIIQQYLKENKLFDAFRIKDSMETQYQEHPTLLTYSVIINGLLQNNGTGNADKVGGSTMNNSLQLYHVFTEIFANSTKILKLTTVEELNRDIRNTQGEGHETSPSTGVGTGAEEEGIHHKTKQHILAQNSSSARGGDDTNIKKNKLLLYLYPTLRNTCYLLDHSGYKRHAHNLATFFLESGGDRLVNPSGFFRRIQYQNAVAEAKKQYNEKLNTNNNNNNNNNNNDNNNREHQGAQQPYDLFDIQDNLSSYWKLQDIRLAPSHDETQATEENGDAVNPTTFLQQLLQQDDDNNIAHASTIEPTPSTRGLMPGLVGILNHGLDLSDKEDVIKQQHNENDDGVDDVLPAIPQQQQLTMKNLHSSGSYSPYSQQESLFDITLLKSLPAHSLSDYIDLSSYRNDDLLVTPVKSRRKVLLPGMQDKKRTYYTPEKRVELGQRNRERKEYEMAQFDRTSRYEGHKQRLDQLNTTDKQRQDQQRQTKREQEKRDAVVVEPMFHYKNKQDHKHPTTPSNKHPAHKPNFSTSYGDKRPVPRPTPNAPFDHDADVPVFNPDPQTKPSAKSAFTGGNNVFSRKPASNSSHSQLATANAFSTTTSQTRRQRLDTSLEGNVNNSI